MTTPTPDAAEIERLAAGEIADRIINKARHRTWPEDDFWPWLRAALVDAYSKRTLSQTTPALRARAAARSDNDRSRYKAQIAGLERERDEARRMLAEADAAVAQADAFLRAGGQIDSRNSPRWNSCLARHASRLAAAKEKSDG